VRLNIISGNNLSIIKENVELFRLSKRKYSEFLEVIGQDFLNDAKKRELKNSSILRYSFKLRKYFRYLVDK